MMHLDGELTVKVRFFIKQVNRNQSKLLVLNQT